MSLFVQDVTVGDVVELEDGGIDGLIGGGDVCELPSRRFKALSVYSTPAGGSADAPDAGVQVLRFSAFIANCMRGSKAVVKHFITQL